MSQQAMFLTREVLLLIRTDKGCPLMQIIVLTNTPSENLFDRRLYIYNVWILKQQKAQYDVICTYKVIKMLCQAVLQKLVFKCLGTKNGKGK